MKITSARAIDYFITLMTTPSSMVVFVDGKKRISFINKPMAEFLGITSADTCVGKTLLKEIKDLSIKKMISDVLSNTSLLADLKNATIDEKERWFRIVSGPNQGKTSGLFIQIFELTDVINIKEEAEAASRAKSEFLANMSHEIRSPMNTILGLSALMETANLNADQKHYFDEINKMSSVLMNIINDILDFSKIESGRFEIIPTHFRTRVLFENICSLANFMAKEKKLTFKSYFDEDLPEVTYADENRIWQILINIISNAVKFTEKGTVKFSLKKLVSDDKLFLRAVISDTGHGIKRENSEKIFLSFEQVDRRLHREVPGTGLGLAITKNLTTLMGGTIKVQSVYGEGSTFTVFLPLVEGKVSKLNSELDIQNFVYLKSKDAVKVLIVDDLDINQVVLSGFLEKHNIEPDMAANGREAIKKVNSKKYDLIFMDHMMSDMDGIEATKQIRKIAGYESVPIIAVSANVISEYKALYLRSGMNDFLSKPVNTKRINDILEKWLPEDKLERGNRRQEQRRISKDRESSGRRVGETPLEQKIFNRLSKIEGLDVQTGMNHTGNKIKGYIIVLRQFIDNTAESALKFRKFQKAQDWKSLSILAHAYKGVFAIIGYPALFVWSKKLEYAAKCLSGELEYGDPSKKSDENDIDSIFLPDNFRDAKLICDTESDPYLQAVIMFRDKLEKKVFGGTPLLKRKKIGRKKLRSLLRELEAVCKTYKAKDGEKTIQALRETYVNKKIDLAVSEIIHLVNGFDYENASLKIMTLEAKLKQ